MHKGSQTERDSGAESPVGIRAEARSEGLLAADAMPRQPVVRFAQAAQASEVRNIEE